MTRFLQMRNLAAVMVLAFITVIGMANMVYAYPVLSQTFAEVMADDTLAPIDKIATLEAAIEDEFFAQNVFIEGYGMMQRALGKETLKEFTIAKDDDGKMHYVYFQTQAVEVSGIGDAMAELAAVAEESGAEAFYLMTPSTIIEGETTFASGIPYPDENEAADAFLEYITAQGVASLDLRETMADSGIPSDEWFYTTDHHWTIQSAFWGFTQLVEYLDADYDITLDADGFYTDLSNYNQILYEESYLGSIGRTVGVTYGGIDDFTLIYPAFTTNYSYTAYNGDVLMVEQTEDAFERALLTQSVLNSDLYLMELDADKYYAYLYGNYGYAQVVNHDNEDGLRVLFIKDSYAVPLAAFLSTTCAEIDLIDTRWYEDSITEAVANGDYDVVIVSISSANLTEEFFTFD